jgi:hypothetical protein
MMPALSVSVAGLLDASNKLSTSASRIVRQSSASYSDVAQASNVAEPAGQSSPRASSPSDLTERQPLSLSGNAIYTPSYAEDVVSMKMATAAYKAKAKMIRASSDMAQELIDSLR